MNTIEKALLKSKEQKKSDNVEPKEELVSETVEATSTEQSAKPEAEIEKVASSESAAEQGKDELSGSKNKKAVTSNKDKFVSLEKLEQGFVSKSGRHIINEEFRAIKRKVLNNAFGPLAKTLNNPNIIMVTSPNPNEGKTFTAINLAMSIALEQDKTVLLVDADVLRPSVMKTIDQPFENGLMEYLLGEAEDLSEVIHHTTLDTLRVIPAGKSHHLSTELLASEKMLESVNEFANRYSDRVVIIDSPPLLGINETAILANLAGQAVIVVQEGKTGLNRLSQAVEQLNPDMAKGFVINKAKKGSGDSAGYYGYYYGSQE